MSDDPEILFPGDPILSDPEKYEGWKQRQIELAIQEADDPNTVWVSNEEVMRDLEEMRKEWRSRIEKERNVA